MWRNDDRVEQSERGKKDVPTYILPDIGERRYLYTADRKIPCPRRSRGATGHRAPPPPTPSPLVLRLFHAASNHHESPFRIGAEPRGTTNARGGFSCGRRGSFFLGRQSDWTVSGRRVITRCSWIRAANLFPLKG